MRMSTLRLKETTLLFAFLVLFQSCKVYYANSTSLEAAVKDGKSAKIIYSTDKTTSYDFEKIVQIDTVFYGLKKRQGEVVKIPIQLEDTTVKFKNPSVFTIVLGIIIIGGIIWGIEKLNLEELFGNGDN